MRSSQSSSAVLGLSGLKLVAVFIAIGLAIYIFGPSLFWQVATGVSEDTDSVGNCPPCACDCTADGESMLLPGVGNTPSLDCDKMDPLLKDDLDKNSLELLSEELKVQEKVSEESQQHADAALLDAKKLASQYQKEAEKCNSGMETCEEAREKSEAALIAQKKISILWEKRARELGWRDRAKHQSIFSRIGLTSDDPDQTSSFLRSRK
ncbi:hypothetical protein GOP47_0024859 [Adiantum capillus-veneris]|uniref:Uncharacterized protein n=1 Tax=Adiantum capillus-veneris TaxID=13818 RepID=A0A9D4U2K0_ADICA|nr:hypothetical protein GOP47_0024859 [Adiantum capillus-veneris]